MWENLGREGLFAGVVLSVIPFFCMFDMYHEIGIYIYTYILCLSCLDLNYRDK